MRPVLCMQVTPYLQEIILKPCDSRKNYKLVSRVKIKGKIDPHDYGCKAIETQIEHKGCAEQVLGIAYDHRSDDTKLAEQKDT